MLKQFVLNRKTLLALAILLLLSILIISIKIIVVKGQGTLFPSGLPMDVLATNQMNNDATSTPNASQIAEYSMTVYPTPTEIPISKYTDLSPNINDQDKFIILVKHENGTYEQFTVGPLRSYTPLPRELPDYITAEIPLQPGDEIIGWLPPANPYRAIGTALPTATQLVTLQATEIPQTSMPYPYP
jgi:hypothetical protein